MKLHKQLKWLQPYLEGIAHMVPLEKLTRINLSFYDDVPVEKALCTQYREGNFTILLKLEVGSKGDIPLEFWAQEEILRYLAHELSHLVHWEHIPERLLLEALIYHQFAATLSRLNYEKQRNRVR